MLLPLWSTWYFFALYAGAANGGEGPAKPGNAPLAYQMPVAAGVVEGVGAVGDTGIRAAKLLLDILACPNCKTKVELVKNGTALKCGTCKRVYPIKDDIPVMLIDEATIEQ